MVELVASEGARVGTALGDEEKAILLAQPSRRCPVPEELVWKSRKLIEELLHREKEAGDRKDARSFGNSFDWADGANANIVVLTLGVLTNSPPLAPTLQGGKLIKDRIQLVGCGLIVVLLMLLTVIVAGNVFHWK
jgi:hypothetical protein